jgi:hypothetical protein
VSRHYSDQAMSQTEQNQDLPRRMEELVAGLPDRAA